MRSLLLSSMCCIGAAFSLTAHNHKGSSALSATAARLQPGTAPLDWASLGFGYQSTNAHVRYTWKDGKWSDAELVEDPHISLHIACAGLHYGQSVFEGLKAFALRDGRVAVFRPDENAKRLARSSARLLIPPLEEGQFEDGVMRCVRANVEFVPPYGSGGSLYIRPIAFGSGIRIGLGPSDEYTLIIMCTPVGEYYKGGLVPVTAVIEDQYDRAAPRGVGDVKVAGNYAADLLPSTLQKKRGYSVSLYLDAKERAYVEEFSTSNFIAINEGGDSYVTPNSSAILKSITNMSLMDLARDMGLQVAQRPVHHSELPHLREVAACGTAVVVTPVNKIVFREKEFVYNGGGMKPGPVFQQLYNTMRAIQQGEAPDAYGWLHEV